MRRTPGFEGSLVDDLLTRLAEQLLGAPELIEWLDLDGVRWHLQRLVAVTLERPDSTADDDDDDMPTLGDETAFDQLNACTDDLLETLLECSAVWYSDDDGGWSVREATVNAAGAAGAALLKELREQAQRPVERVRDLTFLVQLLRDPAYGALPLHQKLHQLQQLLLTELVRFEGTLRTWLEPAPSTSWAGADVLKRDDWVTFTPASSAHNPGRIDDGQWHLPDFAPHKDVVVVFEAEAFALPRGSATASEPLPPFRLRRSVCRKQGRARVLDEQAVAFFCDAQAALMHLIKRGSAGVSKAARARALLDQLAPVMRAEETCWENARGYTATARKQVERLREAQGRAAIREDLAILERALESYAVVVLSWVDGDADPPPLEQVARSGPGERCCPATSRHASLKLASARLRRCWRRRGPRERASTLARCAP